MAKRIALIKTNCCALWEIRNLSAESTPENALKAVAPALLDDGSIFNRPFVLFTGVVVQNSRTFHIDRKDDYGDAFAQLIQQAGLGKVIETEGRVNHTGNTVKCWIWSVNYPVLEERWKLELHNHSA